MSNQIAKRGQYRRLLDEASRAGALVRVTRPRMELDPYSIGYPVSTTEQLVMLHRKSDRIDLDGYEILRLRDIRAVDLDFPYVDFYSRALALKNARPVRPPEIDITTLERAVTSISESYPLLTISRERLYPDEVAIGRPRSATRIGFYLDWITPGAELEQDSTLYRYSSITKVEFGGEYEETLALVAGPRDGVPWHAGPRGSRP